MSTNDLPRRTTLWTVARFERAVSLLDLKTESVALARLVLIDGLTQEEASKKKNKSRAWLTTTLKKLRAADISGRKKDWREFSVVLPLEAEKELRQLELRFLKRAKKDT